MSKFKSSQEQNLLEYYSAITMAILWLPSWSKIQYIYSYAQSAIYDTKSEMFLKNLIVNHRVCINYDLRFAFSISF